MIKALERPLVSIIIPTQNSANTVKDCIKSVLAQTYRPIETIVVDNYSSDLTQDLCVSMGAMVHRAGPERASQRNFGAEVAKGNYVFFLDSDMVVDHFLVQECVEKSFSFHANACIIPQKNVGPGFWTKCRQVSDLLKEGDTLNIAPRFISRRLFLRVGGYDESLVFGEDKDLHMRLVKAGARMILVNSSIYHMDKNSLKQRTYKSFYYGKNLLKYYNKHRRYAIRQLFPIGFIHLRNIARLRNPLHFLGFIILKILEYVALLTGIFLQRRSF